MQNKSMGGNVALKVDIAKAFYTLSRDFLLKVLNQFGFNDTFCRWILCILQSAYISISFNGSLHGYFKCQRGVRQGDPLSPLIFRVAEDVLSRGLSQLVFNGTIRLMNASRGTKVPSHTLYADNIMLFVKGSTSNMDAIKDIFCRYVNCSGQICNPSKSILFAGSMSSSRHALLAERIGFNMGHMPFLYLGVPIFKGRP